MTSSIFHNPSEGGLFDPKKLAKRNDPETSKVAASRAKPIIRGHRAKILAALSVMPQGGTKDDIASQCGLTDIQVARRMGELEKDGYVYAGGYARSRGACQETIWCSTELTP